uniref:Band 4.1-like protein 4 n=1 Tax=Sinocyclocheilus anshuiensis TaxID=1608454 RepID=A0A671LYD1_9TELE
MSCFCSVQEEFYCEVLLLDESKLILTTQQQGIKKSTKGSVVLDYVFSHVNLAETEYFGLRYCDCSHQTYWLDPSKTLAEHKDLITTGPPFTLYFGVKFYAEDPCKLKEEITRCVFSELGDYDLYKHTPGYVSEYRFVPDQKEELEDSIEQIHKTLMGQVPAEAENNYLAIAKTLEMYGVDLHPVFGEKQSEYFLGLTPVGVVVYKNKTQVGKYFWPRMTKVHFKETQFELRVIGRDCNETSFFFDAPSKTACKNLWKCCVEHHTFFRMPENESNSLTRKLSKFSSLGSKHRYSGKTAMQIGREQSVTLPRPDLQVIRTRSKTYPKRSTQPAGELHLTPDLYPQYIMMSDVMSRSRGNTSSGSESENSNREHRKKRNRSRQENEMVDSGPQWEVVLPPETINPKIPIFKLNSLSEEKLKEIPYKKVETQGDPIKIRHSHSPRSFRQYRRSHCSDGERSVLSEVNSRTDLVPPLPVTRTADVPGSSSTPAQKKKGSKDTLSESSEQDAKSSAKVVKTVHTSRVKTET